MTGKFYNVPENCIAGFLLFNASISAAAMPPDSTDEGAGFSAWKGKEIYSRRHINTNPVTVK